MKRRVTSRLGMLLAFALFASACSGSDGGTSTTTAASGQPSSPTTTQDGGTTPPTDTTTTTVTAPSGVLVGLDLEVLATELRQPTLLASPPGDGRIFIGLRGGVILIYDPDLGLLDTPFLSIPDRVASNGIEQGLLGLAFHPDYATNGRFFIYHTDRDQQRQLAEYHVSDDPNVADIEDAVALFDRAQPPESVDIRHYGGMLLFGPDGYLYISSGDGAAARVTGQDPGNFFGVILRIDVDNGDPFAAPADNPFVNGGGDPMVWAYGLRNPWRISIDPVDNLLYIADVGQEAQEEIDVVSLEPSGYNFGWPVMQGTACFIPRDCEPTGFVDPVYTYGHDDGCSITGGHVYRGAAIPELHGHYFFADWCDGWIRSLVYEDGTVALVRDWSDDLTGAGSINVFGVDVNGELYVAGHEGTFAKIVPVR